MALPPLSFTGGPAAPSGATSDNVFDSSGWTVATGGSRAGQAVSPYIMGAGIMAISLILIVWMRRK